MFSRVDAAAELLVNIYINDKPIAVPANYTVAAALLAKGHQQSRLSAVNAEPRGPYCMMGVCFECLVNIDGESSQQACMREVAEGMRIQLDLTRENEEPRR